MLWFYFKNEIKSSKDKLVVREIFVKVKNVCLFFFFFQWLLL